MRNNPSTAAKKNLAILLTMAAAGVAAGAVFPLDDAGAAAWRREVLPLPHELTIAKIQKLSPADVGIRGRPGAAGLEAAAVSNVAALFREKTGVAPEGQTFEILIGLMDAQGQVAGLEAPEGARLKTLPNCDQAYLIQPVGENKLIVAALDERGLYYGTRTLAQWLELHLSQDVAEIPLAVVVDWPDLEERGFWHMPASLIPWLASMKMNRFFLQVGFSVDATGIHPDAPVDFARQHGAEWLSPFEHARQYAAELVRGTSHYDYWERSKPGYTQFYPNLPGQGESAKNPASFEAGGDQRVPCASNPDLVKILTVVMSNLAAQKASEVMIWMSEYPAAHCACAECVKTGQYVAEVKAALAAWEESKKTYPALKLSVFFGRGGLASARYPLPHNYPDDEIARIMAMLPPDVTMRPSMGCDGKDGRLMADCAAQGKRIARMNVVVLTASFAADDIRRRMERIVADKYIGAWQFTPGGYASAESLKKGYNYRLSALAEYSWNARGRTAQEFAEAWACRQGIAAPQKFLAWVAAMDLPQANRLQACWPQCGNSWFNNLAQMAAAGKWDDTQFKPDEIDPGLQRAERALALAEEIGAPDLAVRARLLLAYCRLEQAGYRLIAELQDRARTDAPRKTAADEAFARLKDAFNLYVQARIDALAGIASDYQSGVAKKQGAELSGELDRVREALGV